MALTASIIERLGAFGVGVGSYYYNKLNSQAAFTKSTSLQDVMSRPFPHLYVDQYSMNNDGTLNGGGSLSYSQFIDYCARYCDIVSLNATGGDSPPNDFATETTQWRAVFSKVRRDIVAAQASLNYPDAAATIGYGNTLVCPYQRPDSCMWGSSSSVRTFWTWCAQNPTDRFFYYNGSYNHYSSTYNDGTSSLNGLTRRIVDMRKTIVQEYWAQLFRQLITYQDSVDGLGFDGVFADNNAVSGGGIFSPAVPNDVGIAVGTGMDAAFVRARGATTAANGMTYGTNGVGLIWGNGKLGSHLSHRDFNMMELWESGTTSDYDGSGDGSQPCRAALYYPAYCENTNPYTLCVDNIEKSAYTSIGLIARLGFNLINNGGFSIVGNDLTAANKLILQTIGKIGFPKEDAVVVAGSALISGSGNGFYKREYTGAVILANGTSSSRSYTLSAADNPNGSYFKQVNSDGGYTQRNVGDIISVPAYRAVILKKNVVDTSTIIEDVPEAATNLTAGAFTRSSEVNPYYCYLQWENPAGNNDTGCYIYYRIDGGAWTLIKTSLTANTVTYAVDMGGSPESGLYEWKVNFYNSRGSADDSNIAGVNFELPDPNLVRIAYITSYGILVPYVFDDPYDIKECRIYSTSAFDTLLSSVSFFTYEALDSVSVFDVTTVNPSSIEVPMGSYSSTDIGFNDTRPAICDESTSYMSAILRGGIYESVIIESTSNNTILPVSQIVETCPIVSTTYCDLPLQWMIKTPMTSSSSNVIEPHNPSSMTYESISASLTAALLRYPYKPIHTKAGVRPYIICKAGTL